MIDETVFPPLATVTARSVKWTHSRINAAHPLVHMIKESGNIVQSQVPRSSVIPALTFVKLKGKGEDNDILKYGAALLYMR
jgi:hypothetical protein